MTITGPGAAGKSTLAARLGEITSLPLIELDKLFWRPGLTATPRDQWAATQRELAAHESWIMDGDLGPCDVLDVRLQAADTIVFLDFSSARCAWRAVRRSRERADFWWWLLTYRRRSRPLLLQAIAAHAGDAEAISLVAALHYTGYRHVIGTLWSVFDKATVEVAGAVYADLISEGAFDPSRAAGALHKAVRRLRDTGRPLSHWTPFTHTGP